jgi:hypothetical protein
VLAWLALALGVQAAGFQDMFANRETVTDLTGQIDGSNVGATIEPNEPRHAGKLGGHSVWITWVAPTDGVATFSTVGSSFDTLLSAYYFSNTNDTTLDKLQAAAENDDDDEGGPVAAPASLIQFGARAGHRYEIAVDGYIGATGNIQLRWDFVNSTSPPPIIVSVPGDQAARQGDPVTLTVNMQVTPELDLQWRLNGSSFGASGPTLLIPSLQPTNVGRYTLRIRLGDVRFETTPTELQINTDGQTNSLARDKLFDAVMTPLIGSDGAARPGMVSIADVGVVRGYNGSQIFNTTFATSDPSEPVHCGVAGGASYWLAYQPPTNGTVSLDTIGSSYDTVIEVYTYNAPPTSYADLISITCDDNSAGSNGAARVQFPVIKGRTYAVVVDGVGGLRGTAWLNYRLDSTQPPRAPALTSAIPTNPVAAGASVVLTAPVSGAPPLTFAWRRDGVLLPGVTTATLLIPSAGPGDSGSYSVTVSNDLGPLTLTFPLRIVVPTQCQLVRAGAGWELHFPSVAGQHYFVEESPDLASGWTPKPGSIPGNGQLQVVPLSETPARFYRVRVE